MSESTTTHIPNLTWVYVPEAKMFSMDVSFGVEAQPHGVGTAWAKELHLSTQGGGIWTLTASSISAPGYPDVEDLGGRNVHVDRVDSGIDVCFLLDRGLKLARMIQVAIDEEAAA